MFAELTDVQLIETSEIIVVGTLVEQLELQSPSGQLEVGRIEVETELKNVQNTQSVLLLLPQSIMPVASDTITYAVGTKGLWFLRPLPNIGMDVHAADHPQRFVPMSQAKATTDMVRNLIGR